MRYNLIKHENFSEYSIEELREIINTATKELLKREWEEIVKIVINDKFSKDSVKKEDSF